MTFDMLRDGVTLLGYLTLVVGGCVLGSAGLAYIQSIPARIRTRYGGTRAFATGPTEPCVIVDEQFEAGHCATHNCDAIDQCGKLACPHCIYKFDAEAGVYGYPALGSDPLNASNYASHTNYNTGEPCPVNCTDDSDLHAIYGCPPDGDMCPPCADEFGRESEPTFVRVKRVRPQDFFYELGENGRITDAVELNEDHTAVIAEYHEKPQVEEYKLYAEAVRRNGADIAPHCDSEVLHAPGRCATCDDNRPDLQEFRLLHGINFTGETDPAKLPCPATTHRPLETIERWGGNLAKRITQRHSTRDEFVSIPEAYARAKAQVDACHAGTDGDCVWEQCPQLRDDEPIATGRRCPRDTTDVPN